MVDVQFSSAPLIFWKHWETSGPLDLDASIVSSMMLIGTCTCMTHVDRNPIDRNQHFTVTIFLIQIFFVAAFAGEIRLHSNLWRSILLFDIGHTFPVWHMSEVGGFVLQSLSIAGH